MIIPSDIMNQLNSAFQLTASASNEQIKQGTMMLLALRQEVLYPKVLLDYFTQSDAGSAQTLRAGIEFKIWFQKYKTFADFEYNIVAQTVEVVKQQIVQVYLQSSKQLAYMVQDSIVSIAHRDFPHNWPDLMNQLVPMLDLNNYPITAILRVLKLFRKLFAKYEYSSRSDPLYIEIIHVCDTSHDSLLQLALALLNQIQTSVPESEQSLMSLKSLKSLLRVFYYLNFQDLHPKFEDNLQNWMRIMQTVLQLQGGLVFKCKGEALKAVLLYATKYREDFEGLIQVFSQEIWAVCNQANLGEEYDRIVHNALRYFKSLVAWSGMRQFFEESMPSLIQHLITRNLSLTQSELCNFNEDPGSFIEIFFENSDLESRRAQTVELFKSLCKNHREKASAVLQQYVQEYVSIASNGIDLNNEILIINLVIDGLVVAYTSKDGAIEIQLDQQIPLFFYQQVLKKRLADIYLLSQQLVNGPQCIDTVIPPIVLAFYCRFIFVYRNILPQNEVIQIAQVISKLFVLSRNTTLHKVTSYTLEALLSIQVGDFKAYSSRKPLLTRENIGDSCTGILQDLYTHLSLQTAIEPYSLRCLNVILVLMRENALSAVEVLSTLFEKLLRLLNEGGVEFQNALMVFESIGTTIHSTIAVNNEQLGLVIVDKLLNSLDSMLRDNKGDICTFILQIYSLLVRVIPPSNNQLNNYFEGIFRSFLVLDNWNEPNQSLFPAYILFFEGWLKTRSLSPEDFQSLKNILALIIQFSAKDFTQLSDTLMSLGQMWVPIVLQQIFKQYQVNLEFINLNQQQTYSKSKQGSLQQRMINKEAFLTLSNICMKFGVIVLIDQCTQLQTGLLENFLMNEVVIVRSIQNHLERRQIFTMLTQLLFDGQMKLSQQCWQVLFQSIIENFSMKRKTALRFLLNDNTSNSITSSSGFQKLQALQQIKEKSQPLIDEEKYFGQRFKQFYSDPNVQQNLNIASLINQQQQEMLTQIIQNA